LLGGWILLQLDVEITDLPDFRNIGEISDLDSNWLVRALTAVNDQPPLTLLFIFVELREAKSFPCDQTNEEEVLFTYLVLARTPGMQVAGIGHYPKSGAMD